MDNSVSPSVKLNEFLLVLFGFGVLLYFSFFFPTHSMLSISIVAEEKWIENVLIDFCKVDFEERVISGWYKLKKVEPNMGYWIFYIFLRTLNKINL